MRLRGNSTRGALIYLRSSAEHRGHVIGWADHPNGGPALALRLDPERARAGLLRPTHGAAKRGCSRGRPRDAASRFVRQETRRFANKLTPIADDIVKSAEQLVKDLREMTYLANTAVEQVRSSSGDLPQEAIDGLKSIRDMATVSIRAFSVIEEFTQSIEQVIGFSRELDRPLKKIQKASLNIASLRGNDERLAGRSELS